MPDALSVSQRIATKHWRKQKAPITTWDITNYRTREGRGIPTIYVRSQTYYHHLM